MEKFWARRRKKLKRKRMNRILNVNNPYIFEIVDDIDEEELFNINLKIAS